MGRIDDSALYDRGAATLVASWGAYARGARDAALVSAPGVSIGVFPHGAERAVYNNALLERGLDARARGNALDAVRATYASARIERYAAWVHERDGPMRADLEARGYTFDSSTRAMGLERGDLRAPRPEIDLAAPAWAGYLAFAARDGLPSALLAGVEASVFHVVIARSAGEHVAAGIAFDLDGDCGIYNVGTLAHARRRGLGTAVTAVLAHDAFDRGCRTLSLQATEMAERLYARLGFRDLGRFLEYVPEASAATAPRLTGTPIHRSASPTSRWWP